MTPNNPMTEGEALAVAMAEAFEDYHQADHRDPALAPEWSWWQAAWRAALTAHTAAVPADALERLVVEWRDQAKRLRNEVPNLRDGTDKRFDSARDADRAADELAALIPKGADHGQR